MVSRRWACLRKKAEDAVTRLSQCRSSTRRAKYRRPCVTKKRRSRPAIERTQRLTSISHSVHMRSGSFKGSLRSRIPSATHQRRSIKLSTPTGYVGLPTSRCNAPHTTPVAPRNVHSNGRRFWAATPRAHIISAVGRRGKLRRGHAAKARQALTSQRSRLDCILYSPWSARDGRRREAESQQPRSLLARTCM